MRMLVEGVRKQEFTRESGNPNPVAKVEAMTLVELLLTAMPCAPDWLSSLIKDEKHRVITFGGTTSCFQLLSLVLGKNEKITREDIERAIDLCVGKTTELSAYPQEELVFAKLCLMLATSIKYGINEFDFHWANGSTLGIATYNELWE